MDMAVDVGGHQAAPDRPRDLHPLQHLRGDLPGRRDHARRPQLRRARRRLQRLHGLHLAVPDRLDRQLAHRAGGARLLDRGAARPGTSCRPSSRPSSSRPKASRRRGEARPQVLGGRRRAARRPAKRRSIRPPSARPRRPGRPRTPTPTCIGAEGADHAPPWSATSTAPRPASTARRTTSCSTSAPCRSRCSKASRSASSPPGLDARRQAALSRASTRSPARATASGPATTTSR